MHTSAVVMACCLTVVPLHALTFEELLVDATARSRQMAIAEETLANSDISYALSVLGREDAIGYALASGTLKAEYDGEAKEMYYTISGASASMTIPYKGSDDTTTIAVTGDAGWNGSYDTRTENTGLSVSHTFMLDDVGDDLTMLREAYDQASALFTYASTYRSFEQTLLSRISSLASAEQSVLSATKNLSDLQRDEKNALAMRTYAEGSAAWRQAESQIVAAQATLKSVQAVLATLSDRFETETGHIWEATLEIPDTPIAFSQNTDGNTTVKLAKLSLDIARQELEDEVLAQKGGRAVTAYGSADQGKAYDDGQKSSTGSLEAGVSYAENANSAIKFSASVGATYIDNASYSSVWSPYVTVAGSWSSGTSAITKSNELKLRELMNDVSSAQSSYAKAYEDYLSDVADLENDILDWQCSIETQKAQAAYHVALLDQKNQLYASGLATEDELADAQLDVDLDTWIMMGLLATGRTLQSRAALLSY